MNANRNRLLVAAVVAAVWLGAAIPARAHCDTLDGPVVSEAKTALAARDITPVLKWIRPEHEAELKTAFARTLAVRAQGGEARELADQFFFETLVRLHRAGEGAPYTGLKPAGTKLAPAVEAADRALQSGKADALIQLVTDKVAAGIRQRFSEALDKKAHAEHSVAAGRQYVAAYVEFVHYVEALDRAAAQPASEHDHGEAQGQPIAGSRGRHP